MFGTAFIAEPMELSPVLEMYSMRVSSTDFDAVSLHHRPMLG